MNLPTVLCQLTYDVNDNSIFIHEAIILSFRCLRSCDEIQLIFVYQIIIHVHTFLLTNICYLMHTKFITVDYRHTHSVGKC